MYERVNESISVNVEFTSEGPKPQSFTWKNRKYTVDQINFVHFSKEGNAPLTHFSITSGAETYKITFDSKSLTWTLDEIYNEGLIKGFKVHEQTTKYKAR